MSSSNTSPQSQSSTNTSTDKVKYQINEPETTETETHNDTTVNIPSVTRTSISHATPDALSRQLSTQLSISSSLSARSSYNASNTSTAAITGINTPNTLQPPSEPSLHRIHSSPHVTQPVRPTALLPSPEQPNTNLYMTGLPNTWTKQTLDTYFAVYGRILESRILHDRYVGLSRGIGFVRFANIESCYAVIASQNGQLLPGSQQQLNIRFANDDKRRASTPLHSITQSSSGNTIESQSHTPVSAQYSSDTDSQQRRTSTSYNSLLNQQRATHTRNTSVSFSLPQQLSSNTLQPSPRGVSLFCFHIPPYFTDNDLAVLFAQYGRVLNASIMRDPINNTSRGFGFVSVVDMDVAENVISHLNGYSIGGKFLKVGLKKSSLQSQSNLTQQIQQQLQQQQQPQPYIRRESHSPDIS